MDYAELVNGDSYKEEQKEKSTKKQRKVPSVSSTPSDSRIASQNTKSEMPVNTIPIPVLPTNKRFRRKDPNKTKPVHRRRYRQSDIDEIAVLVPSTSTDPTADPDAQEEESSADNVKKTDADGSGNNAAETPAPPDGKFTTTEHGIKITKKSRFFRCPKCGVHKGCVSDLNAHYKHRHKSILCDKCDMIFYTPSAFERHKYVHLEHRHHCDSCGKGFRFFGELNQHTSVHRNICTFVCKLREL